MRSTGKRIIAEEPESPDRWLKEPWNNHQGAESDSADCGDDAGNRTE